MVETKEEKEEKELEMEMEGVRMRERWFKLKTLLGFIRFIFHFYPH